MRNIILLAHLSLDGYLAGPDSDMGFITIDDEIIENIYPRIEPVETAVYGRVTYQMMESYWPTMLDQADATARDRSHARWYAGVDKVVASRTLASSDPKVRVIKDDVVAELAELKRQRGGDIMIFASPTLVHSLLPHDVIDTWLLTIQPVMLGGGLPLFAPGPRRTQLALRSAKTMSSGVIATHYVTKR